MDKERLLTLAGIALTETPNKDITKHAIEVLHVLAEFRTHLMRVKNSTWFGSNIFRIHRNREMPNIEALENSLEEAVKQLHQFVLKQK